MRDTLSGLHFSFFNPIILFKEKTSNNIRSHQNVIDWCLLLEPARENYRWKELQLFNEMQTLIGEFQVVCLAGGFCLCHPQDPPILGDFETLQSTLILL